MPKTGMEPIRRAQIREAAVGLIAERGFSGTTLRDVAARARVSTGTINHYYANKSAMLVDTLIYVSENNLRRIRGDIDRHEPGLPRLRALVRSVNFSAAPLAQSYQRVWIWAMAEAIGNKELRDAVQLRRQAFHALVLTVIGEFDGARHCALEDLQSLASQIGATLEGIETQMTTGDTFLRSDLAELAIARGVEASLALVQPRTRAG